MSPTLSLVLIALATLGAAAFAFTRRNLIHAALLLVATWAGIAAFYLWAGAEFLGFGQVLVYVGAVSMVVLFAVLLTRPGQPPPLALDRAGFTRLALGLLIGGGTFGTLIGAILSHRPPPLTYPPSGYTARAANAVPVRELGEQLAGAHTVSLLIAGVILTVALLGAITLAVAPSRTAESDDSE